MSDSLAAVRCFLLDMDGTFYLGDQLLEGALRFIEVLEKQGKDYLFLTNNSSRHRREYAEKVARLGFEVPEVKIFTSGEATALHLKRTAPQAKLYVVGTPSLEEEFRMHGFRLDAQQPDIAVLGFDTTMTYEKMWKLCDFVRAGLPYIATHPDLNCPTGTGFMPDIGAMIAFVKASTGREPDRVIGKPNREIIDEVSRKLDLPISQLAMIGDRLYTDMALRSTAGILTVLVLSGETQLADLEGSPFQPTCIFHHLGEVANLLLKPAPDSQQT